MDEVIPEPVGGAAPQPRGDCRLDRGLHRSLAGSTDEIASQNAGRATARAAAKNGGIVRKGVRGAGGRPGLTNTVREPALSDYVRLVNRSTKFALRAIRWVNTRTGLPGRSIYRVEFAPGSRYSSKLEGCFEGNADRRGPSSVLTEGGRSEAQAAVHTRLDVCGWRGRAGPPTFCSISTP